MSATPNHIRPDVRREIDAFVALRTDLDQVRESLLKAHTTLRGSFMDRMEREGLTPAELAAYTEALERKE